MLLKKYKNYRKFAYSLCAILNFIFIILVKCCIRKGRKSRRLEQMHKHVEIPALYYGQESFVFLDVLFSTAQCCTGLLFKNFFAILSFNNYTQGSLKYKWGLQDSLQDACCMHVSILTVKFKSLPWKGFIYQPRATPLARGGFTKNF